MFLLALARANLDLDLLDFEVQLGLDFDLDLDFEVHLKLDFGLDLDFEVQNRVGLWFGLGLRSPNRNRTSVKSAAGGSDFCFGLGLRALPWMLGLRQLGLYSCSVREIAAVLIEATNSQHKSNQP